MQIVIDIDEEAYRAIALNKGIPYDLSPSIGIAILNGTPLPEHDDLVSLPQVIEIATDYIPDCDGSVTKTDIKDILDDLENISPIIPATKEESEESE